MRGDNNGSVYTGNPIVNGEANEDALSDSYRGCADVCPALFDPVCARKGNVFRTFGNECELQRFNCKSGQGE
ncbi:Greglin [Frankliniella fusca]|uniref:Greglin n=1 Tax=Frankliniella fusca TaxID=407009 RepID=A0AAE1HYV0_9NEOP|nr:Greglin [Frankliniella fusca]